jgi:uncharacterized membrane protein YgdD (TMEM256/DUF423 family)
MKKESLKLTFLAGAILFLGSLFFLKGGITGSIVSDTAQGGNVTLANLTATKNSDYWQGLYGQIFVNPDTQNTPVIVTNGGIMKNFNLTFACSPLQIYASREFPGNLENITKGNVTILDSNLNLSASNAESGTSVFNSTLNNFVINGSNITNVPATNTKIRNITNTTFDLALFDSDGAMYIGTHNKSNLLGFENNSIDYQMMIPVNQTNSIYYFYAECPISSCLAPGNFSASLNQDNESINLNWTSTGGVSYRVYHSTNISAIKLLNTSNVHPSVTVETGITDGNWTDSNASSVQEKYYQVATVLGNCINLSNPVAKFTFRYQTPSSTQYGILASNRIAIYLNASYTAEKFLQEIPAQYNPTISRLDKTNASGEFLTTHVRGLADGNNFTLELSRGYQVSVDDFFNHTIIGNISNTPYVLNYSSPNSTQYGTLATQLKGIYDYNKSHFAESFLQEIPAQYNPTISRLDKTNASGEFLTTHVRGLIDGNNFSVDLGVGFAITVDNDFTHTLCTNCFG